MTLHCLIKTSENTVVEVNKAVKNAFSMFTCIHICMHSYIGTKLHTNINTVITKDKLKNPVSTHIHDEINRKKSER